MKERAVVLAFGESGSGKTHLIRSLVSRTRRLIVADITGDFEGCGDTYTSAGEAARAVAAAGAGPFRIRLAANLDQLAVRAYRSENGSELVAERIGLQAAAIALAATSCAVVLDELASWCNPNVTPPVLRAIASLGRHRSVSLVGTSRRPAELSRVVTQAGPSVVFGFRTKEPTDLKYLAEHFGTHVSELPRLPEHHFLVAGSIAILGILAAPPLDRRLARILP